jgi:phage recombination protein Bet
MASTAAPTNGSAALTTQQKPSLLREMAERYGVDPAKMQETLVKTVFPKIPSQEQFIAFLVVANQYQLNPFTKEIYAFPQGGGIVPIVPIDGWVSIVQRHPQYDGVEQVEVFGDDDEIFSVTTKIYRKDQARATVITEYWNECKRDTEPWKKWPVRMLRHKSYIQCARYAFGLSGIADPDEADRIIEVEASGTVTNAPLPANLQRASEVAKEPTIIEAQAKLDEQRKQPAIDAPPLSEPPKQECISPKLEFGSIVGSE